MPNIWSCIQTNEGATSATRTAGQGDTACLPTSNSMYIEKPLISQTSLRFPALVRGPNKTSVRASFAPLRDPPPTPFTACVTSPSEGEGATWSS